MAFGTRGSPVSGGKTKGKEGNDGFYHSPLTSVGKGKGKKGGGNNDTRGRCRMTTW